MSISFARAISTLIRIFRVLDTTWLFITVETRPEEHWYKNQPLNYENYDGKEEQ